MKRLLFFSVIFLAVGVGIYTFIQRRANNQPLQAEFIRLAKLIASQGYLEMNDRYTVLVTDADTVITSIVHNGKRKTIVNYGNQAPIELYGIERAIDGVAAQIKWEQEKQ